MRLGIAVEAARIMATEGQTNYHAAKIKAAGRIGASDRLLPSNREVQEALLDYRKFYGGPQHAAGLEQLRRVAAGVMDLFASFTPRLVGPVLDGTAGAHTRVSLHVFTDTPENLVLHLLNEGAVFEQEDRRIRWHDGSYRTVPVFVLDFRGTAIELVVFALLDLRQAPPCPVDGRPQPRASRAEVELLLGSQTTLPGVRFTA